MKTRPLDIPEEKIRERYVSSMGNLIALLPHLAHLQVYDNSPSVPRGSRLVKPALVLNLTRGKIVWPVETLDLSRTPAWAKPLLESALRL